MCIRREPRRLGDKAISCPPTATAEAVELTGEEEDGEDKNEQQGAAVQTISDPGQGDGGVLDARENMHERTICA